MGPTIICVNLSHLLINSDKGDVLKLFFISSIHIWYYQYHYGTINLVYINYENKVVKTFCEAKTIKMFVIRPYL